MPRIPALLSPAQLGALLGLTPDAVSAAADAGRLPAGRRTPGKHRRWTAGEVADHMRGRGLDVPPELAALADEEQGRAA